MKCNYCGKTEVCKGQYPEGCFLQNDINKWTQEYTKKAFKELGFEFPTNEKQLKEFEEKFKDYPYRLENKKIDIDKIIKSK